MSYLNVFEIIEQANLKHEYLNALLEQLDDNVFFMNRTLETNYNVDIEDFLWSLIHLDQSIKETIAAKMIYQNEVVFEKNGAKYEYHKDGTYTITMKNDPSAAVSNWGD